MNTLEEFEQLSYEFYMNTDQESRIKIEGQINNIMTNLDNTVTIIEILENTSDPYAQLLSITILKKIITNYWNKIEEKQRLDLSNWMFTFLSEQGLNLTNVILNGLSSLYGRLLKISWLEDQKGNEKLLKKFVPVFFKGTAEQYILGLKILKQITIEFSTIIKEREFLLRHRKILASFRDRLLLRIFKIAINSLTQEEQQYDYNNTNNEITDLKDDASLDLIISVLTFDMGGLNRTEEVDGNDSFKVSIPATWRLSFKCLEYTEILFKCYLSLFRHQNKDTNNNLNSQNQNQNQDENNNDNNYIQNERTNERGSKIFRSLGLLASSKRGVYGKKPGRQMFLNQLIKGICYILENNMGLIPANNDLIHEFTRLNDKILLHFNLRDLEKTEMLQTWLSYLFSLTLKWSSNIETKGALYYLGTFWIKATFQLELFKTSSSNNNNNNNNNMKLINYIREIMSKISQTIITYKCQEVTKIEIEDLASSFEEESTFLVELRALRDLTRIDYNLTFQFIIKNYDILIEQCYNNSWNEITLREISLFIIIFSQLISQYNKRSQSNNFDDLFSTNMPPTNYIQNSHHSNNQNNTKNNYSSTSTFKFNGIDNNNNNNNNSDNNSNSKLEKKTLNDLKLSTRRMDGELIVRGIELIKWNEEMISNNSFPSRIEILEFSILSFLKEFLNVYINSNNNKSTSLSSVLSNLLSGFENHTDVFLFIFKKLISNLKTKELAEKLIAKSLKLLNLLFKYFRRMIDIPNLQETQDLIENHNLDIFPFLDIYTNSSNPVANNFRVIFYNTLSKLVFNERRQTVFWEKFEIFIQPFEKTFFEFENLLKNLNQNNINNKNKDNDLEIFSSKPKYTIQYLGLVKDLRGIVSQCNNTHYFSHFFHWIYPKKMEILNQIFAVTYQIPKVTENYFNLLIQLCSTNGKNKNSSYSSSRIFPISSPNLYILFKFACNILYEYICESLINIDPNLIQEQITEKAKTIALCYKLLSTIIFCKQMNFGVYKAFNDDFFEKTLSVCFKLSDYFPTDTILIYPKLAKAYFRLFEVLSKRLPSEIIQLDENNFKDLTSQINLSIHSKNTKFYYKACNIITRLVMFYLENYGNRFLKNEKKKSLANTLHQQFLNNFDNLESVFNQLFDLVLYEYKLEVGNISGTLLGLILLNDQLYINFKNNMFNSVLEKHEKDLDILFTKLLEDVDHTLSKRNQDTFSHNLNSFRYRVREDGILF
ncbi:exportin 7 [Anaeramoeba flamelloides]|uniref:Exportin 7 n=1 Tax=Anaeramoeba flamelloides TaxID=1746091 RepID=A0ABQ8YCV1_9EUKA|nr:exportin 7 [Anaeramoeba flamelloides]